VKCTDTEIEIEIGGALSCQWMLAFLFPLCRNCSANHSDTDESCIEILPLHKVLSM